MACSECPHSRRTRVRSLRQSDCLAEAIQLPKARISRPLKRTTQYHQDSLSGRRQNYRFAWAIHVSICNLPLNTTVMSCTRAYRELNPRSARDVSKVSGHTGFVQTAVREYSVGCAETIRVDVYVDDNTRCAVVSQPPSVPVRTSFCNLAK